MQYSQDIKDQYEIQLRTVYREITKVFNKLETSETKDITSVVLGQQLHDLLRDTIKWKH